jgi:hypothetical protein
VDPWAVTDLVHGKSLTKYDKYNQILKGPKAACEKWLKTRHTLLGLAAVDIEKQGLFHMDLNDGMSIKSSFLEQIVYISITRKYSLARRS